MRITPLVFLLGANVSALNLVLSDQMWKDRPVTKVVNLLRDMKAQLEKEAEKDEEVYEQVACWCKTNDKEKTQAIATANQQIDELSTSIEENTAKVAQLETDIEKLTKEVVEKKNTLEKASDIRAKEGFEFSLGEKDSLQTIGSLGGAVSALGNAHGGSAFSQQSLLQTQQIIRQHSEKHERMFSAPQHMLVLSFLQQTVAAKSYSPQSGAIFGILKGMKESFETNLVSARDDEEHAAKEFGALKTAKTSEMSAATKQIDDNTAESADTRVKLSNAKNDLKDTRATLKADTAFLADLKEKCASMDKQWEQRQKLRAEEIEAVSETIKILNDDEAHATFSRSLGLVQLQSERRFRGSVATFLRHSNAELRSPGLVALQLSMRNDPFAEVKNNIVEMVGVLKTTQEEEVEKRDFCIDEFNANERQTAEKTYFKEDLEQKVEDLQSLIQSNKDVIAQRKQEIDLMHIEMKKATANREAENKVFQMTVADARATQEILAKALKRLKAFYEKKALLQLRQNQDPMPGGFGEYKKAGGATGALGLLEMIIKESKSEEASALSDEQESQKDYEGFFIDGTDLLGKATQEITDKTEELAKADGELTMAEADLESTNTDIINLKQHKVDLHSDCDYLIANFQTRQTARAAEIDSLEQAKAMFSGAKFGR